MEWQLFEILEEKIDQLMKKLETLSRENLQAKKLIEEKEIVIKSAQERINALEEEKGIIKGKVDGILKKIGQVLE
jgi:chromosome segregation ATPase